MSDTITAIQQALQQMFVPQYCQVIDESHLHQGTSVHPTHIRIELVSSAFENQALVARHRMVHQLIEPWFKSCHAISIYAYTPDEWADQAPPSPTCRKGFAN